MPHWGHASVAAAPLLGAAWACWATIAWSTCCGPTKLWDREAFLLKPAGCLAEVLLDAFTALDRNLVDGRLLCLALVALHGNDAIPMPRLTTPTFAVLAVICFAFLGGCSSPRATGPVEIASDRYGVTFDAARDVLRERSFNLARVDSTSGVVTTQPSVSAGLFTPWSRDQQTFDDELDDTLNRQQRTVRVAFEPLEPEAEGVVRDMVAKPVPTLLEVRVTVEHRRHGQQPQPASMVMSSRWYDPALTRRGLEDYDVSIRHNSELERVLLDEIIDRAATVLRQRRPTPPATTPEPATPPSTP